jgi:hypothetical protein
MSACASVSTWGQGSKTAAVFQVAATPRHKKNPALVVCHHAIEPLQHAGRLDCFRRPVKVSATIAVFVPDRLIPVQGQSSKSRTGQGKFGCHFPKNTAASSTMIHANFPGNGDATFDC